MTLKIATVAKNRHNWSHWLQPGWQRGQRGDGGSRRLQMRKKQKKKMFHKYIGKDFKYVVEIEDLKAREEDDQKPVESNVEEDMEEK